MLIKLSTEFATGVLLRVEVKIDVSVVRSLFETCKVDDSQRRACCILVDILIREDSRYATTLKKIVDQAE